MPYIQRDEAGNINGLFANPQEFIPNEEFLPDDDAAVVAFTNPESAVARVGDVSAPSGVLAMDTAPEPTTVSREEFDALVARVALLEKGTQ